MVVTLRNGSHINMNSSLKGIAIHPIYKTGSAYGGPIYVKTFRSLTRFPLEISESQELGAGLSEIPKLSASSMQRSCSIEIFFRTNQLSSLMLITMRLELRVKTYLIPLGKSKVLLFFRVNILAL